MVPPSEEGCFFSRCVDAVALVQLDHDDVVVPCALSSR